MVGKLVLHTHTLVLYCTCEQQTDEAYIPSASNKLHLPTLTQHRLHIDLCLMYKIIHGLMYFPPDIVTPSTTVTHNPRSLLLQEPFARTNAYKNSFLPRSTSNWNSLPNYVVLSPSFSSFNHSLSLYTLQLGYTILLACAICVSLLIQENFHRKKFF